MLEKTPLTLLTNKFKEVMKVRMIQNMLYHTNMNYRKKVFQKIIPLWNNLPPSVIKPPNRNLFKMLLHILCDILFNV